MAIDPRGFDELENSELDDAGGLGVDFKEIDGEFLKQAKVSWLTRTLLAIALPWGLGRLARELGGPGIEMSKKAHALFATARRVDIIPSRSDLRGFQLVIDSALSLFFVQDGDCFVYDGFELGRPFEEGDVTIFDEMR